MPTLSPVLHVVLSSTPAAWLDVGRGPRNPRAAVAVHNVFGADYILLPVADAAATPPAIRVVDADGRPYPGTWRAYVGACGLRSVGPHVWYRHTPAPRAAVAAAEDAAAAAAADADAARD